MTDGARDEEPRQPLVLPPALPFAAAPRAGRFLIEEDKASLWFERRSDVLIVTFDNLATIDEGWPRGPWLDRRLSDLGYSVLGVQSRAKDWYRQECAPRLLRGLEETGFFGQFRRVVLTGASMGGFAALNFAPLIPEARVLAFSAQSTMNKVIAPYERRFPFAVRKSNWEGMPYLDAAAAIPYIRKVFLLYDPFVPEDRAHAGRMAGSNVQLLRADHATHEAVRVVMKAGALAALLDDVVERDQVGAGFWRAYRARRGVGKWQRQITAAMTARRHPKLTMGACRVMLKAEDLTFARRALRQARAQVNAVAPAVLP
ncbi:MAG: hypothetical protein JSS08_02375 [Proteobacteria bacterium]|nr:hypothetical protein [Pseudomonadota bacterium]